MGVTICAALIGACSVVNDLDVCEREAGPEVDGNVLTPGAQQVHGRGSIAELPGEGGLLAFVSAPMGESTVRREVRLALLTQRGEPIRTCDADGGGEIGVATFDEHGDALRYRPFAAASPDPDGHHLVVWSEATDLLGPGELRGRRLWSTGCLGDVVFAISDSPEWKPVVGQVAVTGVDQFAVVWSEAFYDEGRGGATVARVMARVLDTSGSPPEFLGTVRDIDGGPVQLPEIGDVQRIAIASIDEDRFAVAAMGGGVDTVVRVHVFDDRLEHIATNDVARTDGLSPHPEGNVEVAFDGEKLLVVWTQPDGSGAQRAMARLLDPFSGPVSGIFRIGSTTTGDEVDVTAVARPGGGFFVAWQEENAVGRTDGDGSGVRGVMLDPDGEFQFANPACGQGDFALNATTRGNQESPSLAVVDGSVFVAWTDDSGVGLDRSESGVRLRVFRSEDLLPNR